MRKLAFLFILLLPILAFAQKGKVLNAINGLAVELNGTDGNRNADQIWFIRLDFINQIRRIMRELMFM
ncbi:MAG: hypothetical protein HC846_01640 [Blastocatellia bacterium]|nr:hypothetical protein [Blastocatellia bacterium]